jgi:hypothetical protein
MTVHSIDYRYLITTPIPPLPSPPSPRFPHPLPYLAVLAAGGEQAAGGVRLPGDAEPLLAGLYPVEGNTGPGGRTLPHYPYQVT